MIPSPNVTNNHQYKNAKVLEDAGATVLIEEKDLSGERLAEEIRKLRDDPVRIGRMEESIGRFSVRDSNSRILEIILGLTEIRKNS